MEAVPLDEWWKGEIPRVDLIKMDIEGYEPTALRGMHQTIKKTPSAKLLTEFYHDLIRKAGDDPTEFIKSLESLGFTLSIVNELEHLVSRCAHEEIFSYCTRFLYVNLLCQRKDG